MTIGDIEKLNDTREYWHDKLRTQIDDLLFISLAGDQQKYKAQQDAIETTMIIIWRFDRKLQAALND